MNLPDITPPFTHDGHLFELRGDRIVRDDTEVCVLISPGFGAGFVTWCDGVSPFEPRIVALVLTGHRDLLAGADTEEVREWLGAEHVYLGGAGQLTVQYVPLGVAFDINEYDGSESLVLATELPWTA
jgi:hypothetical protein